MEYQTMLYVIINTKQNQETLFYLITLLFYKINNLFLYSICLVLFFARTR